MPKTRIKYTKLPPGAHTYLPVDHPEKVMDPDDPARYKVVSYDDRIVNGDVHEVEDLNDPKSERAYQVRGHLYGFGSPGQYGYQGPLAVVIEGPGGEPLPPVPDAVQPVPDESKDAEAESATA